MHKKNWISVVLITLFCLCLSGKENGSILFIAGHPSHGSGKHEYPQSCQPLAECLNQAGLRMQAEVSEGWPSGTDLGKYSTIVIYSDGLEHHVANGHVAELTTATDSGTGLVVLHFATEPDAHNKTFFHGFTRFGCFSFIFFFHKRHGFLKRAFSSFFFFCSNGC